MNLLGLFRFNRAELIFSVTCFAAAMLAMYVASRMGQPRPFWALMTTYVVANPLAGAVRSKGLFRMLGTLLGSTAALLLVPALSNTPELLTLALALWLGVCLYFSLQDRTPRSYVFMLAAGGRWRRTAASPAGHSPGGTRACGCHGPDRRCRG